LIKQLIVVASIHQPSTATFRTFDKLLILSGGRTCYFGEAADMKTYFDSIGHVMPEQTNPAEFVLDLVNTDFTADKELAQLRLLEFHSKWDSFSKSSSVNSEVERIISTHEKQNLLTEHLQRVNFFSVVFSLLHRLFIKSYRDVVAYGIRVVMYLGS
jgi:ABC-type multidrug transport system ATPase subunit